MVTARALATLAVLAVLVELVVLAGARSAADDILYDITDEEYYAMPELFHLDEYWGCVSRRELYCVGTFDLEPLEPDSQLYRLMQRYSADWVDHYNHTRLHRGTCVTRRCPHLRPTPTSPTASTEHDTNWFGACVNETVTGFGLSARLSRLEYCERGPSAGPGPPSASARALATVVAVLVALAAVSTTLDLTLTDAVKKNGRVHWALSWSVVTNWRTLRARPVRAGHAGAAGADTDLRVLDGLRVVAMLCVIVDHVVWLATVSYVASPRYCELMRRSSDVMLMTNSTLMVQVFFVLASFLLAHKLLRDRPQPNPLATFCRTLFYRIIRITPCYMVVVWWAASWWPRLASGPLWAPLVGQEADLCHRKWWTHLLFLNNLVLPDDKCLIQTWYLAADMQLYACGLTLTLALRRRPQAALPALMALFAAAVTATGALAYSRGLVPTFVMHRPELVRTTYSGEGSFNSLYQSPLGNAPAALAGLILAHLHHALRDSGVRLADCKWFRWWSVAATPVAAAWLAASPLVLGRGPPPRASAAALAALERPLFCVCLVFALLGALHGVRSPWRRWMSWSGWTPLARLSFGALLVHMPLNKTLVASRLTPVHLDRQYTVVMWFGVSVASYLAALPLALLVELPPQRLLHALTRSPATPPTPPPPPTDKRAPDTS